MPKEKQEFILKINSELCKSCGLCVEFCGRDALEMQVESTSGKNLPVVNKERCNGCQLCEWYCPDLAIFVVNEVLAPTI
jgi:2-oxoglutarate ferredoxin oxidoreductase subunit delta